MGLFNTAKQKLLDGRQAVAGTVHSADPETYLAMAGAGFDCLWIEMQHSALAYSEVARAMLAARGSAAIPFIRVPDATEGDIQKATDIGALGIIVPMVESAGKMRAAVRFARFPPGGRRSSGNNQARLLWGDDYRQTCNENLLVVAMIETPEGVAAADEIAAVEGVDVVFAASFDLKSFTGLEEGHPDYQALVARIRDATLGAGKKLGGPLAWRNRPGFSFFQGPSEAALIKSGATALGLMS